MQFPRSPETWRKGSRILQVPELSQPILKLSLLSALRNLPLGENFDTGAITGPGKYRLNDETHARLLDALAKESFSGASLEVRGELLDHRCRFGF